MRLTARKNSTDVLSRVQRMTSFIPVLTLCALLTPAFAAQESSILNGTVENLYQTQRYEDAAKVGLEQLLSEPWNHDLRFLVYSDWASSTRRPCSSSHWRAPLMPSVPCSD
jgi:hypothetical protein